MPVVNNVHQRVNVTHANMIPMSAQLLRRGIMQTAAAVARKFGHLGTVQFNRLIGFPTRHCTKCDNDTPSMAGVCLACGGRQHGYQIRVLLRHKVMREGAEPNVDTCEFDFSTKEELEAFQKGLHTAAGWLEAEDISRKAAS